MTTTLTRRLAAVTGVSAALVATLAVAAPAHAEKYAHTDPARDVETFTGESRPGVSNGDVRRFTASHTRNKVVVRASFRDLAKQGQDLSHFVPVETPSSSYQVQVLVGPQNWEGQLFVTEAGAQSSGSCGGADHAINYRENTLVVSVPRKCLGAPRWVRVGLGTQSVVGGEYRGDDAQRKGNVLGNDIALTPRLSRAGGGGGGSYQG